MLKNRDEGRREGLAGDSLCSRNARPQKALVGRAHDGKTPGRPSQLLREKERHYGARRVIDQDALEKVQCLCFITQYLMHFAVQVLNRGETALHEIH